MIEREMPQIFYVNLSDYIEKIKCLLFRKNYVEISIKQNKKKTHLIITNNLLGVVHKLRHAFSQGRSQAFCDDNTYRIHSREILD